MDVNHLHLLAENVKIRMVISGPREYYSTSSVKMHSRWAEKHIFWVRNSELNGFFGNQVLFMTIFLWKAADFHPQCCHVGLRQRSLICMDEWPQKYLNVHAQKFTSMLILFLVTESKTWTYNLSNKQQFTTTGFWYLFIILRLDTNRRQVWLTSIKTQLLVQVFLIWRMCVIGNSCNINYVLTWLKTA